MKSIKDVSVVTMIVLTVMFVIPANAEERTVSREGIYYSLLTTETLRQALDKACENAKELADEAGASLIQQGYGYKSTYYMSVNKGLDSQKGQYKMSCEATNKYFKEITYLPVIYR